MSYFRVLSYGNKIEYPDKILFYNIPRIQVNEKSFVSYSTKNIPFPEERNVFDLGERKHKAKFHTIGGIAGDALTAVEVDDTAGNGKA